MKLLWDDWNIEHITAKHRVSPEEVEEAIQDARRRVSRTRTGAHGYRRYKVVGRTLSGRYLRVVIDSMPEGNYVVTAFDAPDADIRAYRGR